MIAPKFTKQGLLELHVLLQNFREVLLAEGNIETRESTEEILEFIEQKDKELPFENSPRTAGPAQSYGIEDSSMREMLTEISKVLTLIVPMEYGFTALLFDKNINRKIFYLSTAMPMESVELMKQYIHKFESHGNA